MKEIKIYTSINSSCSTLFMIIARANLNWGQALNKKLIIGIVVIYLNEQAKRLILLNL